MKIYNNNIEKYQSAADVLISEFGNLPKTAVIAGSGIAATLDNTKIVNEIPYSKLPNLPNTTVFGHSGNVLLYNSGNSSAIIFSGRFHYYEGRTIDEICSLVILSYLSGIKRIVFTNAAGSLNPRNKPGDIMIIEDTIDFMFHKSENIFYDNHKSSDHIIIAENKEIFSKNIKNQLIQNNIPYKQGVYAAVTGPNYETRAEIRMLRKLGADAVGMSTVPEINATKALGLDYIAFSLITNSAKEVKQNVSHDEVINEANKSSGKIRSIIEICIETK
jgi:purine-nucleoside phosphorylase